MSILTAGLSEPAIVPVGPKGGRMVIVGVDAHTRNHAGAVIDDRGRVLGQMNVGAAPPELERLIEWVRSFDSERLVAVEGARGLGLALVRRLIAAGETVVDVPAVLTADGRRRSGRPGRTTRRTRSRSPG